MEFVHCARRLQKSGVEGSHLTKLATRLGATEKAIKEVTENRLNLHWGYHRHLRLDLRLLRGSFRESRLAVRSLQCH